MSMPPMDVTPGQLWMTVTDVFHIKDRGTVVTGQLEGQGFLNAGDWLSCDDQRWQVGAIEQFKGGLMTAGPGMTVGVLLRKGPVADVLRGKTVQFEQATGWQVVQPKKKRWRR